MKYVVQINDHFGDGPRYFAGNTFQGTWQKFTFIESNALRVDYSRAQRLASGFREEGVTVNILEAQ